MVIKLMIYGWLGGKLLPFALQVEVEQPMQHISSGDDAPKKSSVSTEALNRGPKIGETMLNTRLREVTWQALIRMRQPTQNEQL